jgi:hypothetical protein
MRKLISAWVPELSRLSTRRSRMRSMPTCPIFIFSAIFR